MSMRSQSFIAYEW